MERKELAASINRFLRGWTARAGLFSCADTGIWMASEPIAGGLRSAREGKIFAVPVPGKTAGDI